MNTVICLQIHYPFTTIMTPIILQHFLSLFVDTKARTFPLHIPLFVYLFDLIEEL